MSDAANRAGTGQLIGVRMQPDELAAIDSYRRDLPGVPSRPEAMRRLCVQALDPRADNSAAPPHARCERLSGTFSTPIHRELGSSFAAATKTDARRSGRNQLFPGGRHELLDPATRGARRARSIPALRQGGRSGRAGICARMHTILDDKAIADQDQYLTTFAKGSRRGAGADRGPEDHRPRAAIWRSCAELVLMPYRIENN